jgi:ATP synthase protein I
MFRVVFLQAAVILVVAAAAGLIVGVRGAVSVLLGGVAYWVPNLLFVVRLKLSSASGHANVVTFIVGELLKVAGTIVILGVAQRYFDVHWLALLVGLFAALKSNLFALLLKT